jgi:hypothetical protein
MSIQVENEQAAIEEATTILLERLPASKVARLLAAWRVGEGDYLAWREKHFAGETVESLCQKAQTARSAK